MRVEWREASVDVRESGSGPCLVLVHGYPLDGAMWSGVARTLAARFRVLKPDLPGHGENAAMVPQDLEGHADFLEAILRELPPPVGLAGFSMGGYVCLTLWRRSPGMVRALAFVDTRAEADDEEGKKRRNEGISAVRSQGVAKIAETTVPKLLAEASLTNRDLVDRLRRIILRQTPESIEADLTAMRDRRDSGDVLAGIRVPTLVLVGEQDALTPPPFSERLAAGIPGARLVTIAGAGHLAPMEKPGAVAEALGDFFAGALAT